MQSRESRASGVVACSCRIVLWWWTMTAVVDDGASKGEREERGPEGDGGSLCVRTMSCMFHYFEHLAFL